MSTEFAVNWTAVIIVAAIGLMAVLFLFALSRIVALVGLPLISSCLMNVVSDPVRFSGLKFASDIMYSQSCFWYLMLRRYFCFHGL